jgi:hypothetical protein
MMASAIADSISSWCRSAIRWREPTSFTAARPAGVFSTLEIHGGTSPAEGTRTRLLVGLPGFTFPANTSLGPVAWETSA